MGRLVTSRVRLARQASKNVSKPYKPEEVGCESARWKEAATR